MHGGAYMRSNANVKENVGYLQGAFTRTGGAA